MKFYETSFEYYLQKNAIINLHPKLEKLYKSLPAKAEDLKNLLFYGPVGIGKYTQMLAAIQRYSPSKLKYEKKISAIYNKYTYFSKISDIHYEVDLSILGCHSKIIWNDVYNQIVDIVLIKPDKTGIIVCKNFHEIHIELLESFYSYMQTIPNNTISLKFIIISESISFIPDNILNCCKVINVSRPTRSQYNKCFKNIVKKPIVLENITNIKNLQTTICKPIQPYEVICNAIYNSITKKDEFSFTLLREQLYDTLVYNLNIDTCIWYLIEKLISENRLNNDQLVKILVKVFEFFKNYNNNYRPIYHLERIAINIIQIL